MKSLAIVTTFVVCAALTPIDALAQHRGGGGGGGRPAGGGGAVGHAAARVAGPAVRTGGMTAARTAGPYTRGYYPATRGGYYPANRGVYTTRGYGYGYGNGYGYGYARGYYPAHVVYPRVVGYYPYHPYYYPYRAGITVGFYAGFGYGYPYGVGVYGGYGYPYGPYPYPYPYAYPGGYYGVPYGYQVPPSSYITPTPGAAYGGVRLEGAPHGAQVFVDGYYMGVTEDFDGPNRHLNLQAGAHRLEIRAQGNEPIAFDVTVTAGQTVTYRADVRPPSGN